MQDKTHPGVVFMFKTNRKRVGIAELCMVALILMMSAGMLMACAACLGDIPVPPSNENNDAEEVGEVEFETRTASPALQFAIIAVMILILGGVIYVIFRKSDQKNLSRQQKRAMNKQQEKKQNKNKNKNNNNRKNSSGKTNATAPKKKSKNKRKK